MYEMKIEQVAEFIPLLDQTLLYVSSVITYWNNFLISETKF